MSTLTVSDSLSLPRRLAHRVSRMAQPLRLDLGAFDLAIQSDLPDSLTDLAHLYRNHLLGPSEPVKPETISVRAQRCGLPMNRFTLYGDGEPIFTRRKPDEVLPYIEWAVNWRIIARGHRFLQLHAAALSFNSRGAIFVAPSGSGKSTLAAALLARRWQYLCDEFALIHPDTGLLHPFPKALCIKFGSFDVVRSLGLPLYQGRHYVKALKGRVAYLAPSDIRSDIISAPVPLHAIILPRYTPGVEPMLREIPRARAVMQLAEQAFNRHAFSSRAIEILIALARGAQCYELTSGDLPATCQLVESLFD